LEDFLIEAIEDMDLELEEYVGHLFVAVIDEEAVEEQELNNIRLKSKVKFEDLDKLETWIGSKEVDLWKTDYANLEEDEKDSRIEIALYSNNWNFLTSFITNEEDVEDNL
jgi:antibiotic biosynthesis monooxygenase (ABM) superfamily enzyme